MAVGSGLGSQLGFIDGSGTYGTYVAPTSFIPFTSESLQLTRERIEVEGGLGATNAVVGVRNRHLSKKFASGSISGEVYNKSFGPLFRHMLGGTPTTDSTGTAYRHTYTIGDIYGRALTVQVGRPLTTGVVVPFSYLGGKVTEWTLSNSVDNFLKLDLSLDFQDEVTSQALASASYATNLQPFPFVDGSASFNGSALTIRDISIKGTTGVGTDRFNIGSSTHSEPVREERPEIEIEVEADYDATAQYAFYQSDATGTITATWEMDATAATGFNFFVRVSIPVAMYDGETPTVEGPDRLTQKLKFKALYDGTNSPISIIYQTTDATA